MYRLTEAVKHLLIINGLVFLGVNTFFTDQESISKFALFYPESPMFRPWQLITHMFMHGSVSHLMFNMLSLFFIGPLMESVLGMRRFLIFYFVSGLGGAVLHFAFQYYQFHFAGIDSVMYTPAVGASGAINGLFIGLAYLFPDLEMFLMFIPIPIKARYLALGLLAYDLLSGISGMASGIAHFAHLGGALFGFLLLLRWTRRI
ncbi:MAG: rhomboid family intramembrane serine protease [Saprospiraceae bacterium]|nr:rhomboid family intramembrane serine protease [Saprospiraceae bacterium]HMW38772.1 rhomboid family intramembrane serine protease [Saprospiraceae bacterium]HMX88689.1 rhomboid family intramembrane serine protease [Saprospiraceae bacterium]HMZ40121.1 rhomboid family intramembrane serine protease [Saprospiraceae bacterium]HNA65611.1 rhomboid family intramembrane serine protease [Saprospiraceae bacterium]